MRPLIISYLTICTHLGSLLGRTRFRKWQVVKPAMGYKMDPLEKAMTTVFSVLGRSRSGPI